MNNQTIDGVPRETVEITRELAEQLTEGWNGVNARIELRKMLDTPAKLYLVECDACPTSGGCVSLCMKAPKLATPPQGEPVAKLSWEQIVGLVNEVIGLKAHEWPLPDVGHVMTGINFNSLARIIDRVQAEQPAPVEWIPTVAQIRYRRPERDFPDFGPWQDLKLKRYDKNHTSYIDSAGWECETRLLYLPVTKS